MALKDELDAEVADIFSARWQLRDGYVVPDGESLTLGNVAVRLNATVLYADMAGSTGLVDGQKPHFAAEIYKAFLRCSARIIRKYGGEITAYDGDRIMAVYIGETKNTSAVRSAMGINYAAIKVINPAIKRQYPENGYSLSHVAGIDTSQLFVAKTGARGANDLVWVGRAANHAAKLSALPPTKATYITRVVYDSMSDDAKFGHDGRPMWEPLTWNSFDNSAIYGSAWTWEP